MNVNAVVTVRIPVIDLTETGKNIKRIREESRISVRELQTILGFTNPQAIYKWQNGECLLTIDNLVILAAVLGVTVDEILVTDEVTPSEGGLLLCNHIISGINAEW